MTGAQPVFVSDAELVAFLDGEFELVEAERVAEALRNDPALCARARAMQDTAEMLRRALGPVGSDVVPSQLLQSVMPPLSGAWRLRRPRRQMSISGFYRAAAAVLLLVLGASGGWIGARLTDPAKTMAAMDSEMARVETRLVQEALETLRSGGVNSWRDRRTNATLAIAPVRTFKDGEERFCREFRETVTRDGKRTMLRHGIACRDPDGQWTMQFYLVPAQPTEPALDS